ncbi:organic solvent tolerance protein OstA [Rossellomorea vietnamensis]|uniref:Organic solvent tolerance protein OstA n=1 Tax=Rossellomorea vietnamensis TaxID=218284 RepID=A0A5D4NKK4_9BACI|nr:organic solvent tolerance protein OstA [Rossellomorea vietnamensis]TYS14294.1 organic solvent tolerance protein OstA [Rossellomorea vietnamensis]
MSKVQLNQKEQHYADTREEAEEIISAAKENDNLQMHKITEKYNKYGQYFLIDLTYAYQTPKEVMESRPKDDNVPEGQMSIDDHNGIEYSVDGQGNVEVSDGQQSNDEDDEKEVH